jgi:hypothetical protein
LCLESKGASLPFKGEWLRDKGPSLRLRRKNLFLDFYTFEYNEDGISVRVPGVYGWVCPETGEVAFTPETAKELVAVVRQFIASAKQAKQMRTLPSEYIVSVA